MRSLLWCLGMSHSTFMPFAVLHDSVALPHACTSQMHCLPKLCGNGMHATIQQACSCLITAGDKSATFCMPQGRLGVAEAVDAARLEEAAQIEEWGLVEGGHDIDISDIKVQSCCSLTCQHVSHNPPPAPARCSAVFQVHSS